MALTDALGNHERFVPLPGHRIDGIRFDALIADKAFDGNTIIHLAAAVMKSR